MTPTNLKDIIARARELHQKYTDAENHLQHVSALEQLKTFSRDTLPLLCDALEQYHDAFINLAKVDAWPGASDFAKGQLRVVREIFKDNPQ